MQCKKCTFWDGDWMPEEGDEGYSEHQCQGGKCRRNSPKFITAAYLMIPGEEQISNAEDICFEAEWPLTLHLDWCGEFKPAAPIKQDVSVDTLDLGVRAIGCLFRAGVKTLDELEVFIGDGTYWAYRRSTNRVKNLGERTFWDIRHAIRKYKENQ